MSKMLVQPPVSELPKVISWEMWHQLWEQAGPGLDFAVLGPKNLWPFHCRRFQLERLSRMLSRKNLHNSKKIVHSTFLFSGGLIYMDED